MIVAYQSQLTKLDMRKIRRVQEAIHREIDVDSE